MCMKEKTAQVIEDNTLVCRLLQFFQSYTEIEGVCLKASLSQKVPKVSYKILTNTLTDASTLVQSPSAPRMNPTPHFEQFKICFWCR